MFRHTPEFYNAIALGIDAENAKATAYIKHGPSLGNAREIILRDVVREATPEPFRFGTGFIHHIMESGETKLTRQCDVLVYDPTLDPPKYSFENFVILGPNTVKIAIEVKSDLDSDKFNHAVEVSASTAWFRVPTLVFAYDSVSFEAMLQYFHTALQNHESHLLPTCLAVHKKNYVAVQPLMRQSSHPVGITLLDYSAAPGAQSWASTATFLQLYDACLRNRGAMSSISLYRWFNSHTALPSSARRFVRREDVLDGTIAL
jgi:hypothetical protein